MKYVLGILLALVLVGGASGEEPDKAAFRFPSIVSEPPAPLPTDVIKLPANTLFVVESDEPFLVLASPPGIVTVVEESGPVRIYGRFIDSPKVETRTYSAKSICWFTPLKSGRVELLFVKVGETSSANVARRQLDVEAGEGPRPPPVVVDPPKPIDPVPDPPPVVDPVEVKDFKVLFLWDKTVKLTREQSLTLNSTLLRAWVKNNTVAGGYRYWDVNIDTSEEVQDWKDILTETKTIVPSKVGTPALVVIKGTKIVAYPLPATEADTLAFLKAQKGVAP